MALPQPRILFGVHNFTPYDPVSRQPYGTTKVIGSASVGLSSDLEQLYAGSSKYAWAAEAKTVNAELSLKIKEYPDFLFQLFLGATVTTNVADASGSVINFINVKGTSIKDPTNGISGIVVTTAANLKYGKYILIATGPAAADVYPYSDVDLSRGASVTYIDGSLKIGTVAVSSASQNDGATTGLTYTKVGTPAFVTGDSAEFTVRPPSVSSSSIVVGAASSTFKSFGAYIVAQKRATGEIFTIEAFQLVASGLPIALEEQAFSQPEAKLAALYDSTRDGVFRMEAYKPA